jgi:hypothetical protein
MGRNADTSTSGLTRTGPRKPPSSIPGWENVCPLCIGSGKVTPADATDEMNLIWKGIPDFHADNFEPFPTEHGCAWRVRYSGHTLDGEFVAQWEGGFIWTDEDGRITRYEFYEDYDHHDKIIRAVVGTSSAEFNFEEYGQKIEENRKA